MQKKYCHVVLLLFGVVGAIWVGVVICPQFSPGAVSDYSTTAKRLDGRISRLERTTEAISDQLADMGAEVDELDAKILWLAEDPTPLQQAVRGGDEVYARRLIADGADIDARTAWSKDTALHVAIQSGQADLCELLLDAGADSDARDRYGNTPLHEAASRGMHRVVQLLVDAGAEVNAKEALYRRTPLDEAALRKDFRSVIILCRNGARADQLHPDARHAVNDALSSNNEELIEALGRAGAFKQELNPSGLAPLHLALEDPRNYLRAKQILSKFLSRGVDVNLPSRYGRTVLHMAAEAGRGDIVDYLLGKGADPNVADDQGFKPRDYAAQQGHRSIVGLLDPVTEGHIAIGALFAGGFTDRIRKRLEEQPRLARQILTRANLIEAVIHGNLETVRLLKDCGMPVESERLTTGTALMYACRNNQVELVEYLLEIGADPDERDGGLSAFSDAILNESDDALKVLLEHADVREKSRCLLHEAVQVGNVEAVEMLLYAGARPETKDSFGKSAYDYAEDPEIRQLLKEGAKRERRTP